MIRLNLGFGAVRCERILRLNSPLGGRRTNGRGFYGSCPGFLDRGRGHLLLGSLPPDESGLRSLRGRLVCVCLIHSESGRYRGCSLEHGRAHLHGTYAELDQKSSLEKAYARSACCFTTRHYLRLRTQILVLLRRRNVTMGANSCTEPHVRGAG